MNIWIVVLLVFGACSWIHSSITPKCRHGIEYGNTMINGKLKCPECQKEEERKLIFEAQEKQRKLALQAEEERQKQIQERERLLALKAEEEQQKRRQEIRQLFDKCVIDAIKKKKEYFSDNLETIHNLSPSAFEDFVANLYRHMGYDVKQTPYTNDGGKDAYVSKDGVTFLVECKRYAADARIGRPMLQKLYAAMNEEHIKKGIFITTASYTKDALEYGKKYNIQTINGDELVNLIHQYINPSDMQQDYTVPCLTCGEMISFPLFNGEEYKLCSNGHRVNNVLFTKDTRPLTCPKCGRSMVLRTGKYGRFYGCTGYPECNYTIDDSSKHHRVTTTSRSRIRTYKY